MLFTIPLGANSSRQIDNEFRKIDRWSKQRYRPDFLADLSTYRLKFPLYNHIISSGFNASFVPLYRAYHRGKLDTDLLFEETLHFLEAGGRHLVIHAGLDSTATRLITNRKIYCCSRGGGLLIPHILKYGTNPYFEKWNDYLDLFRKYKPSVGIGSCLRPPAPTDSLDHAHTAEINNQVKVAAELSDIELKAYIEGPGHLAPLRLRAFAKLTKGLTIWPLGPILGAPNPGHEVSQAMRSLRVMEKCCHVGGITVVTNKEHLGGLPAFEEMLDAFLRIRDYKIKTAYPEKSGGESMNYSNIPCGTENLMGCERCGEICPGKLTYQALSPSPKGAT